MWTQDNDDNDEDDNDNNPKVGIKVLYVKRKNKRLVNMLKRRTKQG